MSKVNLVDLAGSERFTQAGLLNLKSSSYLNCAIDFTFHSIIVAGIRAREGSNINKSLSTLGLVIAGLAERSKPASRKKVGLGSFSSVFILVAIEGTWSVYLTVTLTLSTLQEFLIAIFSF